ncbi:MAG: hypothetical protein QHJ74_17490 [Anaerolineae bacterium]|nr:hypothetical protein [Anaerolineae bacterium]
MLTRRDFIKILAAMGTVLLSPLNRLKGLYSFNGESSLEQSATLPQTFPLGEVYAGFLLLPDGAPVPPTVKYPERGMPTFCGVGAGRDGPEPTAVIKSFSTVTDLAREIAFPVYTLSKLTEGLRLAGANLIQHKTGEVSLWSSRIVQGVEREVARILQLLRGEWQLREPETVL